MKRKLFMSALVICLAGLLTVSLARANGWAGPFEMRSRLNGACLTLLGSATNGTNIGLRPCDGRNAQKWYWDSYSGSYRIRSYNNTSKCVDVKNWSGANGDNVHLWTCHTGASQQWDTEYLSSINAYRLHLGLNYNQCMDLQNWSTYDNVHTWSCHTANSQIWYLK